MKGKTEVKNNVKKAFSWILVFAWMLLILGLSSQAAETSNELSTGFAAAILRFIDLLLPGAGISIGTMNLILRKAAHFASYMILGILLLNAFRRSGIRGAARLLLVAAICVIYALSDEIHQIFVPGREGMVRDVIIDMTGTLFGIGVYIIAGRIKGSTNRKKTGKSGQEGRLEEP